MTQINPASVIIITPTHDGNVVSGYAGALASCAGLYGGISFIVGNSNVAFARNLQAAAFLQSPFEWLLSIDADIQFSRPDMELLYEGDELIVCAEYAKKDLSANAPAQFGFGFTRIHRSVFGQLTELTIDTTEHGPQAPMVGTFVWEDKVISDFFPTGPARGGVKWMGEDHGFFHLVQYAGIKPRIEKRTQLVHWGRMGFRYQPTLSTTELPAMR
jgi:glycosyltransferase involved in cell wall biosynthesis